MIKFLPYRAGIIRVFLLLSIAPLYVPTSLSNDLNPLALPAVGDRQLRILTPTLLELSLVTTKDPDPSLATTWNFVRSNYVASLPGISEFNVFVGGTSTAVAEVGFKRRPLYAPLRTRDLRIDNAIYLRLSIPVLEGQTVTVKNPSGDLWGASDDFSAVANPLRFNPAIHVNQIGYMPLGTKKAMVGYYIGSLGEMPVSASTFSLVTSNGVTVFSGGLVRRPDVGFTYTNTPYQEVFEADFSSLQTPGEYLLKVPGMGVSYSFLIHNGTASAFARALALGLYHQRCGSKNSLPYTRYEHDACHIAPAQVPTIDFTAVNRELAAMSSDYTNNPLHTAPQLRDVNSSLYPFINTGLIDVSGGHHDAGDYSKYTINSAGLIHHLVFAADSLPGAGSLDNFGIPESGNGRPDLLEEAKWEADFLSKMQDADGGFYFLVYPRDREYEDNVLPDKGDPQVVFPKTTAATAAAVGALAEIASSPRFKQLYPNEAASYLSKAKHGWDFLTNAITKYGKNGAYQKITHYGNEFMHDDELAWAAAAMFVATGDQIYFQQLRAWYDPSDPKTRRWTWWRLFEGYGCATRAFAFAARSGRLPTAQLDAAYLAKCEAEILAAGDDIARFAEQTAYGTSFPDPNKSFRTAGWYFSSERAFEMAVAQQITPKKRYIDAIISNMNYEGGCNPLNVTYITGLGWKRWREIVHQYAQNDHRILPPTGLPLGNIQGGFAWLENYKQELGALCFPPDGSWENPYPFYDRWGDSFNTTTEFVVVDQARSLATLAFLMAQTTVASSPCQNLLGAISGLPQSIPANQNITATLSIDGVDLANARIVWEARDQEPFIGNSFRFAAKNPGDQWIEVEAQLPDGRRVYGRTNFIASTSSNATANSWQSAPVQNSGEIVALYHLDSALSDATGKNVPLTLWGNARLDSVNLGWMANRAGAALHFDDQTDKATVSIPVSLLKQPGVIPEITLEAMVFVNSYKAYDRAPARLASLQNTWNASVEWMEDMYTGPHLRGGTQFDIAGTSLSSALTLQKWHHLSITISTNGYSARVDGQQVGSVSSGEFVNWSAGNATLEVGNFDGWVDELVIRNTRPPSIKNIVCKITNSGGSLSLNWNSEAGKTYKIYSFPNVATLADRQFVAEIVSTGEQGHYQLDLNQGQRFFLIETP